MLFDDGYPKLLPSLPIDKPQFAHEAMGHGTIHNYPLSYSRAVGAQSDSKRWPVSPHASIVTQFPDKLGHDRTKQHGELCLWRISATVGLLQQRRKRQLLRRIWQSLLLGFCPPCSRPSDEIELRKLKPVWRKFISYYSYYSVFALLGKFIKLYKSFYYSFSVSCNFSRLAIFESPILASLDEGQKIRQKFWWASFSPPTK